jgi:hypothetical protein
VYRASVILDADSVAPYSWGWVHRGNRDDDAPVGPIPQSITRPIFGPLCQTVDKSITSNRAGSVAISDCGQKDLSADRIRLCGEPLELLSERRLLSAGVFRLSLSHHVHHFDAAQDRASATRGLEPHHRANPPLDGPMILLDAIVEVGTLADANGFQITL